MGITDKFGDMADKAKGALGANKDKADDAIDKAGDQVDERTGGKYGQQVDKGQDMARDAARRYEER
jgi:antitoxin protein of toxin-antitoxin system